jgi:hypothetical protein
MVHHAKIVAPLLVHLVPRLLTADTVDFGRLSGLVAVVPLVAA